MQLGMSLKRPIEKIVGRPDDKRPRDLRCIRFKPGLAERVILTKRDCEVRLGISLRGTIEEVVGLPVDERPKDLRCIRFKHFRGS